MALLIFSKDLTPIEDVLKGVVLTAFRKGLKFRLCEYRKYADGGDNVEIILCKHYDGEQADEDYFFLWLTPHDYPRMIVLDFKGLPHYRLGVTDQAYYDPILYDFALEYLWLMPQHYISIYGDSYFSLSDMEALEARGGYSEGWWL